MLTEICQYLKNWFNRKPNGDEYPKEYGTFTIENGIIDSSILANGQYYRIIGSLFNDGVHKYGDTTDSLVDEVFEGAVWSMGVPPELVVKAEEIEAWKAKYGADSAAMSPFQSESFGGYSYTKEGSATESAAGTWQSKFGDDLRKIWGKI